MTELHDLRGLTAGAAGGPAVRDPAGELAELRRQQRQLPLDAATPLVRDAGAVYAEVMGPRVKAHEQAKPRPSTFL